MWKYQPHDEVPIGPVHDRKMYPPNRTRERIYACAGSRRLTADVVLKELALRRSVESPSGVVKRVSFCEQNKPPPGACMFALALVFNLFKMLSGKCDVEALFSRKTWNVVGFEKEECPVGLFWAWLVVYSTLIAGGNLEVAVMLVWMVLMCWISMLVLAAGGAAWILLTRMRLKRRLFKLQLKYGHLFMAQTGEMSKREWKKKFLTNQQARKKEKRKALWRSKRSLGQHTPVLTPQLGSLNLSDAFERLANIRGIPIDDSLLSKIENLGSFFMALKDCETTSQFLAISFLYFKTHYSKSVANTAAEYLSEALNATFDAQVGEFGVKSNAEKPKWLRLLKECQENWALVIRNEGFKKLSHVLSLCLALGLCDSADLDFKIGGMKLFSIGAFAKHASAIDLIDAAFETIVYFAEGGYTCFERGSIKPLLYGNMENEEFEENYSKCMRCHEYARAGNLEKFEDMSENDYEALLAQCIEKCQVLLTSSRGLVEKNFLRRKMDTLRLWQATFRQTRVQGGLRAAPYSIGCYGGTSVGKSSVAHILMITTLLTNGYAATDDRMVTINESDKFMSNYRSFINGIFVDDIGNTKKDFVEKAPTTLMIQLINNVRMYANMAEADMKGKVSVEPKVVITTKNVKDSCATVYSNEPASVTRRDRITLTIRMKSQYSTHDILDEEKVRKLCPELRAEGTWRCPDLWDITVERSYPIPSPHVGGTATVGWETIEWGGKPLVDVSLAEVVRYVAQDSKKFYENQAQVVRNSNNVAQRMDLCPDCRLPRPDICQCLTPMEVILPRLDDRCPIDSYCVKCEAKHAVMDNQLGEKIAGFLRRTYRRYDRKFRPKWLVWSSQFEDLTLDWMIKRLDWLEESRWIVWTNYIPDEWIKQEWCKALIWWSAEEEITKRVRASYMFHILFAVITCLAGLTTHRILFLLLLPNFYGMAGIVKFEKEMWYSKVVADNAAMPKIFKLRRDRHVKWITGVCLVIAALYGVAMVWRAFKVAPAQGNLNPSGIIDIKERDSEVNPWAGVVVSEMPCSEQSRTTTPDTLQKLVETNLCYMELKVKEGARTRFFECDAFFPKSNVALVPQHMWKSDDIEVKFTRHDPSKIGGNFSAHLYRNQAVDIPDTDLSLVWVPNGGDWKDLTPYLPTYKFHDVPARLTYKNAKGGCIVSKTLMKIGEQKTQAAEFFGASYDLQFDTFEGLCMAPLITETKGPLIGGFHLGGWNGDTRGCSGLLLKDELDDAFEKLKKLPGVVTAKSAGTIPKKLYDVQFFESTEVHPKSAINFLPEGTNCKYYGQVTGRATYHSDVEETIISPLVSEFCGVPQQWGGPKFRKGWPFQASLQYSTKPSIGIEGSLLEKASNDYLKPIFEMLDEIPELKEEIRPLTEMETVCGRDGVRFIDKMPPSTSIGFPLSGPKSNFLTMLDPKDHPTHQCPAELNPIFWDHAAEMEQLYLKGERAYPIFKACLKDEPTKLTKDKVRVFQGAPCALQLLIRKYYLPIARILSMQPLLSECAVGINAQGPEWDQLARHVMKYGKDRILAGDYSKYDLRMPAQVMFAAFRIMMDIARHSGNYSERDLCVMEGIATDVCYPLMAYNGDLIQHYGSNPSGQNLTVYINSIVNALLFRCAFYQVTKDRTDTPEFRDVCALITYGDDAKSSVRADFPEFNHISVAQFLEDHDMKFTMPDKESEPTPYMTDEEADLLKRKNVYSEDTGVIMGALDEDSIFKSLHATLKSKALTKEQQSMQNIDGALREWFSHGREKYEERRQQLLKVAEGADILHGCSVIHETYDDRLTQWKDKYE